jgi:hypothetical protein
VGVIPQFKFKELLMAKNDQKSMAMTQDEMDELKRLREENAILKERSGQSDKLSLKLSPKGGISAYGLGRFPTTLYVEQWTKILDNAHQIREFMKAHDKELKRKQ